MLPSLKKPADLLPLDGRKKLLRRLVVLVNFSFVSGSQTLEVIRQQNLRPNFPKQSMKRLPLVKNA